MPRYIDADILINRLLPQKAEYTIYEQTVYDIIQNSSTADVVPKSELEQLQHKYDLAVAEREANVKGFTEELEKAKTDKEKYFSPQDVRKMTPKEVHENYTAIRRSMDKWN